MRNLICLIVFISVTACHNQSHYSRDTLSLAGEWHFRIDSLDRGIEQEWYNSLADETVQLPGSMTENGKGYEVDVNTSWVGDIIDRSYFNEEKYERYRQPGNIKVPFWLKPDRYYKGVAWYNREVEIPENWTGKRVMLNLERCHWESTLFVNGTRAGSNNSLSTPHLYDITDLLVKGKNLLSVRIDNRVIIPIGVNSHSISDHTQSNWNGITGRMELVAISQVYIDDVKVFPDITTEKAKVIVSIVDPSNKGFEGNLKIEAALAASDKNIKVRSENVTIVTSSERHQSIVEYKIRNPRLWSEFSPTVYSLTVSLIDNDGNVADAMSTDFGMREFRTAGTRFQINGIPAFLRGTTECCIFPLTGYPPADTESWIKVLQACKDHGLNHVRFHSFCPPEAAFDAADRLGIYFHVECPSWANQGASVGNGGPVDRFIYEEGDRIMREYGNHPSFCMMAYGNEPSGRNHRAWLGELITYWKSVDNRRVYTSAAGWPIIPENEYNVPSDPRIQHWGEGLKSIINAAPPQTMFDYRDFISRFTVPTVSHEAGQWCVYPDFSEIEKYTGVLKPTNFEIFRESLEENGMGHQAREFLLASGKLQALCYKAEVEAALRTPGMAGFELLQLHDFPGQGTALVGVLNPFFGPKGYISPEEFRMFCNETVPLARMEKMIYTAGETFKAQIEVAHFGPVRLKNAKVPCRLLNSMGDVLHEQIMKVDEINIGNNIIGVFEADPGSPELAEKLVFEVSIEGTEFINRWDMWVYPGENTASAGEVIITDKINDSIIKRLQEGGRVLLLTCGRVAPEKGAKVAIGFSSVFWNTAWTGNQPPHTLGILCDPDHPVFKGFPTEYHSNWQWWDPVAHSQAMIIDGFPVELKPLIQPIDTWFENRRLALAFEVQCAGGKLMVCSIDMTDSLEQRPVTKQLLASVLNYMNSGFFDPVTRVDLEKIQDLTDFK